MTQAAGPPTTPSEPGKPFERIEVGVDGSPGAAAALRWAARLAHATGAEVLAVYVIDPDLDGVRPLGLTRAVINEADWRRDDLQRPRGRRCAERVVGGHDVAVARRCLAAYSLRVRLPRRSSGRAERPRPMRPVGPGQTLVTTGSLEPHHAQEGNRVDNPATYLHLGFIVISLPNLALIAAMIVLFAVALFVPFPHESEGPGGRR